MTTELEKAINYSQGNPKMLTALVRQEAQRANTTRMLLAAVLKECGPVKISNDTSTYLGCGFALQPSIDGLTTNVMPLGGSSSAAPAAPQATPAPNLLPPEDVLKAAQHMVDNDYRGPLTYARKVFDWVVALQGAAR